MISVKVDKKSNSLHVKIIGDNSRDQISTAISKVFAFAAELDAGFCVINDLSQYNTESVEDLSTVCKVHKMIANEFKLGKVIRVVGRSKENLITLSRLDAAYDLKNIHYVPTMSKALEFAQSCNSAD